MKQIRWLFLHCCLNCHLKPASWVENAQSWLVFDHRRISSTAQPAQSPLNHFFVVFKYLLNEIVDEMLKVVRFRHNIRGNMFIETEPRWKEFEQLNDTCPFHLLGTCTSSEWKSCLCTNTVVAFWINQDRYEFLWRLNEWQAKLPEELFEGASSSALTASYWAMTSLSRCSWSAHMKSGCWRSTSAIQSNSGSTLIQAIGLLALKQ